MRSFWLSILLTVLALNFSPLKAEVTEDPWVRFSSPQFLTFDELATLSQNPYATANGLQQKLDALFKTPVISNEAYYRGVRPPKRIHAALGPFLRAATWNIEKSYEIERVVTLFKDREQFKGMIDPGKAAEESDLYQEASRQRDLIAEADVILLQEMDIGVKRSEYVDAARMLAEALDMNYAYGTEYLEIDPVYLGLEQVRFEEGKEDKEATEYFRVDKDRYRGAFGSAVLSRYPIKRVEIFPLRHQGYDWYHGEKARVSFFEEARRFGGKTVFLSQLHREMKVGNRIFMRVDLHVPELPGETLTVINIHLEIKCEPKGRDEQLAEILEYIRDIRNPVLMAGDFNSAPDDLSPTSLTRATGRFAKNPTTWLTFGVQQIAPQSLIVNATRGISNITKNFQNPTARHIPVVAPNVSAKMFKRIEDFRFADGRAFDFRGDSARSSNGKDGKLANSNQRDFVGFKTSFQLKRTIGSVIGKYRLDWMFVKSFLKESDNKQWPYRFAPHFGETLEEMNVSLVKPLSDHHPCLIDLPFEEPRTLNED